MSGGVDTTSGKDFEEVSYTFVLDDNKAYGGYFIDIDQMLEISNAIVTKQLESGYMTGQKSDELERQAYQLLELYYTPEQLAFMEGDLLDETLKEAKKSILTTELAVESFKGKHLRSIDAFNFGKDVAVTSLQLIVLAIAISNPGTALAGAAYAANGGVGVADGAIRIDQGDTFNGAMEMSLSFLEVGGGLKLVSETTSLGKYVDEFIRDNRGCVGAKKAVEGGKETELFSPDEYYKKIDENIAKAIEARDAEVARIQGLSKTQQSKIATVVGGVDIRTGEVYVGVKNSKIYAGNASCAEDIVFRGLGGNTNANIIMTPAVRPRTGEIIPVCTRCQTKYPVNQFVKGTTFQ